MELIFFSCRKVDKKRKINALDDVLVTTMYSARNLHEAGNAASGTENGHSSSRVFLKKEVALLE